MNRASKLALVLCLVSTASLAQISVTDNHLVLLEAGCPIGIHATLGNGGNLLSAQRLQVTLTQWPPFGIVASHITVHGIAAVADRPEPSEITQGLDLNRIVDYPRPNATVSVLHGPTEPKQVHEGQGQLTALDDILGPQAEPILVRVNSPDTRWYAWVSGFTAVNFIDLESVSYADGTSWHVSNGKTCRVSVGSSVW
jgi:hypothetical protein